MSGGRPNGHSGSVRTQQFAQGGELEKAAVKAGLTWSITNGVVEGKVNKLKLMKRMGYGRADLHSECFSGKTRKDVPYGSTSDKRKGIHLESPG